MNINFKTRAELKNFFKKNAIPTASNFADLIDAAVNQKDDGLLKPAGEPLSLEASLAASKQAIRFYETFTGNTNPSWVVSLVKPNSAQSAFVLSDALGNARLMIEQNGPMTASGALTVGSLTATGAITAATISSSGLISANAGLNVTGAPLNVGTSNATAQPLTVWGAFAANGTASVTGLLTANGGISTTGGINTATLSASGNITTTAAVNTGTLSASGAISANGGLTIAAGKTLTANGVITAAAGITISGPAAGLGLTIGAQGTPVALLSWGMMTTAGGLTVGGPGATVGSPLNAPAPLNVFGALTVAGAQGEIGLIRRNLPNGQSPTVAGDRYNWYNPDGVARLWTIGSGDLMTVRSNGFVGFGVSDPQYRLDVLGRMRLYPGGSASAGMWLNGQGLSTSSAVNERAFMGLMDDNNVGFYGNAGSAGWRLWVNTTTGNLTIGGNVAAKVGAGGWANSSDARLKQNIGPLHNALGLLLQLRGTTYEWIEPATQGNETGVQIGFIAQEVEKVFPDWIIESEAGYKLLSIRGFEALAVEAFRELHAEHRALQQSHQQLQSEIAALNRQLQTTGELT